ncbi:HutD family protein [Ornithinimicrobium tianjinense]|uniref:Major facilitator superfamily (MFS) profile domain-containing protein n=1 Tax=Ornithinimicrobium tianjinense TaxID=1195761 RepID=A0A917F4T6_9MICO|nr:HutD family protein [Ornithinimicrobium tianjinense]GGF46676.1 hypothetical protein GCM10011366_12980 [Ornithinimicrobium tianjinense]
MTHGLRRQVHTIGGRRAWVIWLVGLAVYTLAIFHRTSLSVAGIVAAERFDISAGQLSTFTVVQLLVYALMQVPVGVLLDRFGSKRLMLLGLSMMTLGQLWFAFAGSFGVGLAARVLLGAGDAMVFTCLLRLVALWFHVKQAPVLTQLSGVVGQLGAVAAATPLAASLEHFGWTRSYAGASALGVVLGLALLLLVKDSPYTGEVIERIKIRALAATMATVWGNPGTRLGLWVHFTSQFGPTVFAMLWGYPFLVAGQGLSPATAGGLLVLMTVTGMIVGPLLGALSGRFPYYRSAMVLGLVAAIATVWAVVLLWPGRAPLWLLVLLVVITALGGPGSMVGFDLARTFHDPVRLGRASGVVNVGGFTASLLTIGLIGLVLDTVAPGGPETYTLDDFRIAMSVQFPFWAVGAVQLLRYRRKGLAHLSAHPGALEALRGGETLLPGVSRAADVSPRADEPVVEVRTPTLVRFGDLPVAPWRNGGGVTREVVADDEGRWRVSIADIDQPGPFSAFPGTERTFTLLEGEVELVIDDVPTRITPLDQVRFPGEASTRCESVTGRARALNLMTLRGAVGGRVELVHLGGGLAGDRGAPGAAAPLLDADVVAVVAVTQGPTWVPTGGAPVLLQARDVLVRPGSPGAEGELGGTGTVAVVRVLQGS